MLKIYNKNNSFYYQGLIQIVHIIFTIIVIIKKNNKTIINNV